MVKPLASNKPVGYPVNLKRVPDQEEELNMVRSPVAQSHLWNKIWISDQLTAWQLAFQRFFLVTVVDTVEKKEVSLWKWWKGVSLRVVVLGKERKMDQQLSLQYPKIVRLKEWQIVIPKMGLTQSSRLCWRHFNESDIILGRSIGDTFFCIIFGDLRMVQRQNICKQYFSAGSNNQKRKHKPLEDLNTSVKQGTRCKSMRSILGSPTP